MTLLALQPGLKAHESARGWHGYRRNHRFQWSTYSPDDRDRTFFLERSLLALEWLVLGRAAHGEVVVGGNVLDGWRVKKDGRLDMGRTAFGSATRFLCTLKGRPLLSNFTLRLQHLSTFGPDLDRNGWNFCARLFLSSAACECAVTLVSGLIVVRFAAKAVFSDLKLALRSFLQQFELEAWLRTIPSAENVVVLKIATERRIS